jgi:SAM-dependent methyltransferase
MSKCRSAWVQFALALALSFPTVSAAEDATQTTVAGAEQPVSRDDLAQDPQRPRAVMFMGRVIAPPMHFSGAGWLVRAERDREEQPAKLLKALDLKEGQVVCDFGCGNGFYTLELAKRVGPRGAVHAVDIQPEMLELLAQRAGPRGLDNVRTVLATAEDSGLPAGTFDLVLMVDVYHELADPAAILKAVHESLKPSGRLAVVEFREEDPEVPILPLHKMSQAQVMREVPTGGFKLVGQFDELPRQHVLFFARVDASLDRHTLRVWSNHPQRRRAVGGSVD